jgi:hypothetical protein
MLRRRNKASQILLVRFHETNKTALHGEKTDPEFFEESECAMKTGVMNAVSECRISRSLVD